MGCVERYGIDRNFGPTLVQIDGSAKTALFEHAESDGSKLLSGFAKWRIDGTRPSRLFWRFKNIILPPAYRHAMVNGRECMVAPQPIGTEARL